MYMNTLWKRSGEPNFDLQLISKMLIEKLTKKKLPKKKTKKSFISKKAVYFWQNRFFYIYDQSTNPSFSLSNLNYYAKRIGEVCFNVLLYSFHFSATNFSWILLLDGLEYHELFRLNISFRMSFYGYLYSKTV